MVDFYEIAENGLFNQITNVGGMSFSMITDRSDYEIGKFTFEGHPINRNFFLRVNEEHLKELITIKLCPQEMNDKDKYLPFQKVLTIIPAQGIIDVSAERKNVKKLLLWGDSFKESDNNISFEIKPRKIKDVKQALILLRGNIGKKEDDFDLWACFGSFIIEEINLHTVKVYFSGNNTYPDYNDMVIEISSKNIPIKEMIEVV